MTSFFFVYILVGSHACAQFVVGTSEAVGRNDDSLADDEVLNERDTVGLYHLAKRLAIGSTCWLYDLTALQYQMLEAGDDGVFGHLSRMARLNSTTRSEENTVSSSSWG